MEQCDHLEGLNGTICGPDKSTIQWHRYRVGPNELGPPMGLCKKCFRPFEPEDPDYGAYYSKRKRAAVSTAGLLVNISPKEIAEGIKAQKEYDAWLAERQARGLDEFDFGEVPTTEAVYGKPEGVFLQQILET